eukprot:6180277-Pleurochrysis_carterae.AAC.2
MASPEIIDMQAVDVNGCGANFTWINAVSGVDENAFDDQGECTDPTLDTAFKSACSFSSSRFEVIGCAF